MRSRGSRPRDVDDILRVPWPDDFAPGARNAIRTCLGLSFGERFTLITDEATLPIAASLASEARALGNPIQAFVLEDYGDRPMTALPAPLLAALERTDASVYACRTQAGELPHRIGMMRVINSVKPRHGHMVNITPRIMREGMRADFIAIDRLSARLLELASAARTITARTRRGTDIAARFSPELQWVKTSGIITRDAWSNLPGGEIFTSPERIDGVFVVDGVVGEYLCEKYGDLADTPLRIEIEDSRIRYCACENTELLAEFLRYCGTDENSNRVGEFAIGTNTAITGVIGSILQDEKLPGIHIAFGHPYSEHTGAAWNSSTHIDVVGRDFDIFVEGRQIMRGGVFTLDDADEASVVGPRIPATGESS